MSQERAGQGSGHTDTASQALTLANFLAQQGEAREAGRPGQEGREAGSERSQKPFVRAAGGDACSMQGQGEVGLPLDS